jgi:hypothetical protein
MARLELLALLLAVVAAAAASANKIDRIVLGEDLAEAADPDAEFALVDSQFTDESDETERDDEEDMNIEMDHVDDYILKTSYLNLTSAFHAGPGTTSADKKLTTSSHAPEQGIAGMCVPACYRHGKLSHKPKVKCDRFICKACAQCYGKPSGSSLCHNSYSSMITRVKYGMDDIPNCGGHATSLADGKCKLPMGKAAFDTCDLLGNQCAGVMVSHDVSSVVLKGPFPQEADIKTGTSKWYMCVK